MSSYAQPFGVYTTPLSLTSGTFVTIATNFTNLLNLIPNPTTGVAVNYMPDFDEMPPHTASKLRAEITALAAVFAAALTVP